MNTTCYLCELKKCREEEKSESGTHLQETADIRVRVDDVSNAVDQFDVSLGHGVPRRSLIAR